MDFSTAGPKNEYNKILAHPHIQLVYAEILERDEKIKPHKYKIKNKTAKKF